MGSVCSGGAQPVGSWAGSEAENPFETRFNKKERQCLRETWQQLNEPKDIVGTVFVEIIEANPELRKVFGVERAPKAGMLKMPKLGGHVARFTELIEQVGLIFTA
uniref:EcoEI R protein C-terminal domain-containing protein n=1 Tax=Plectus sambesii TaxID=2011161 RepID=A0A914XHF7_9BILA